LKIKKMHKMVKKDLTPLRKKMEVGWEPKTPCGQDTTQYGSKPLFWNLIIFQSTVGKKQKKNTFHYFTISGWLLLTLYWLLLTLYWLLLTLYWLSTDFYWLSTDSLLISTDFYWLSTDIWYRARDLLNVGWLGDWMIGWIYHRPLLRLEHCS